MTQIYHILNGDSLAKIFAQTTIRGNRIVCRECLIDGPLSGDNLLQFWAARASYISSTYNFTDENYMRDVAAEFEKIINLPDESEICLWFENDLFCQANMWFILSLIASSSKQYNVFRVYPVINNIYDNWKGFGISTADLLEQSYRNKVLFTQSDLKLGNDIWSAYKAGNFNKLHELSRTKSVCFQYLEEVCVAHIDRFPSDGTLGRPEKLVSQLLQSTHNFNELFAEFSEIEGIYGFGDLQVKNISHNMSIKY